MQININTKYNIGDQVYSFKKEISGCWYKGYIYKAKILAITITAETYIYETDKGLIYEKDLFTKLKDVKQWAKDAGYIVGGKYSEIKYCG